MVAILDRIVRKVDFCGVKISTPPSDYRCLEFRSRFKSKTVPSVSLRDYVARMVKSLKNDEAIYIVALMFIDRLVSKNQSFLVNSLTVHR